MSGVQKLDANGNVVQGEYNATPPTYADGSVGVPQLDASGNSKSTLATALSGEDLANDVQKVEQRFSRAVISTATTTIIAPSSGFIHSISILGGTLGAITVYDSPTAAGDTICPTFTPTAAVPCPPIILDETFGAGLTIVTAAATIINVSYRINR